MTGSHEHDEARNEAPSAHDARVHVEPGGHKILVSAGESLLDAALRQGYRWPTLCHGAGECTTCFVKMLAGVDNVTPARRAERDRLDECGRHDPDFRLACQLEVCGPITVLKRGLRKKS